MEYTAPDFSFISRAGQEIGTGVQKSFQEFHQAALDDMDTKNGKKITNQFMDEAKKHYMEATGEKDDTKATMAVMKQYNPLKLNSEKWGDFFERLHTTDAAAHAAWKEAGVQKALSFTGQTQPTPGAVTPGQPQQGPVQPTIGRALPPGQSGPPQPEAGKPLGNAPPTQGPATPPDPLYKQYAQDPNYLKYKDDPRIQKKMSEFQLQHLGEQEGKTPSKSRAEFNSRWTKEFGTLSPEVEKMGNSYKTDHEKVEEEHAQRMEGIEKLKAQMEREKIHSDKSNVAFEYVSKAKAGLITAQTQHANLLSTIQDIQKNGVPSNDKDGTPDKNPEHISAAISAMQPKLQASFDEINSWEDLEKQATQYGKDKGDPGTFKDQPPTPAPKTGYNESSGEADRFGAKGNRPSLDTFNK